jgi:all-trans-retinol 13,14-reductase
MTAANMLGRSGYACCCWSSTTSLAAWRPGSSDRGHIFDISLHGFPYGMVKSCRRYWSQEIADSIVQLEGVRFENPMFSLTTTYDRETSPTADVERFAVPQARSTRSSTRPRDELLRRSARRPESCSSGSFPDATTSSAC